MKVLLIRHAHAVDQDEGLPDDARWLSAEGRTLAERVGAKLRDDEIIPDAIVSSPLVRAVQTGELVARGLGYSGIVEILTSLAPDGSVRRAQSELVGRGALVAAVGHEPRMSTLAAQLCGRGVAAFKKGQALLIDDGRLIYALDPDRI